MLKAESTADRLFARNFQTCLNASRFWPPADCLHSAFRLQLSAFRLRFLVAFALPKTSSFRLMPSASASRLAFPLYTHLNAKRSPASQPSAPNLQSLFTCQGAEHTNSAPILQGAAGVEIWVIVPQPQHLCQGIGKVFLPKSLSGG